MAILGRPLVCLPHSVLLYLLSQLTMSKALAFFQLVVPSFIQQPFSVYLLCAKDSVRYCEETTMYPDSTLKEFIVSFPEEPRYWSS